MWVETTHISRITFLWGASPALHFPFSLLAVTVQWRHQPYIKRQWGGEIKVISLYLSLLSHSESCIYSHFFSLSFPLVPPPLSSSRFNHDHVGENRLVTTPAWCPDIAIKIGHNRMNSLSLSDCLSLSVLFEKKQKQSLQRLSVTLTSHLLFSHNGDPSHPWDFMISHGW